MDCYDYSKIFWEFLSGYSMGFKLKNNVQQCVPTDFQDHDMWSIDFGDFAYVPQASNFMALKCVYMALVTFVFQKHNNEREKGHCSTPNFDQMRIFS